jgi:hypothetical protein
MLKIGECRSGEQRSPFLVKITAAAAVLGVLANDHVDGEQSPTVGHCPPAPTDRRVGAAAEDGNVLVGAQVVGVDDSMARRTRWGGAEGRQQDRSLTR